MKTKIKGKLLTLLMELFCCLVILLNFTKLSGNQWGDTVHEARGTLFVKCSINLPVREEQSPSQSTATIWHCHIEEPIKGTDIVKD